MKKSFTLLAILFCCSLSSSMFAQSAKQVYKRTPAVQSTTTIASSPSEAASPGLVLAAQDLMKFGYTEEFLTKNFKKMSDGYYMAPAGDKKAAEIKNAITAKNTQAAPADVLMSSLPKIKHAGEFDQTAAQYHAQVEELLASFPSVKESLGTPFYKAFMETELFTEMVKAALDKGHSTK